MKKIVIIIASVLFLSSFFVLKTMYSYGKDAERIAFQEVYHPKTSGNFLNFYI
ncbi:hypothetical protein BTHERMOSOX_964 [Bathymodiolus thermophilus thioautotrophic gill symbiont]|uniref:Uncharacterized protein n=1 Tax=Bathymodiolus thermophilus thioautotrophic gill symbiont TaxID=2360 RepID=A0A8H8XA62_9GAMM|nr:hypothetical protein [Bathymodiolus thermophilus thioautotrophic gill symbiont]CAB5495873.1 hypothetical protein THERMOS_394 [Bathymodiolus thermophilus thioautotrophic gill symbiont]CAB5499451.1 hypothetical protein THERMOT_1041 [Bathymodiolus thermophilus thioautotrophic gill symbiont]SHA27387.1 hypothetical protein BTHERMOSOX_964 [Bathymodiolus thermophilus thioautotrophic gill symbiont]